MSNHARTPAGSPKGGQFASTGRPEADVDLTGGGTPPRPPVGIQGGFYDGDGAFEPRARPEATDSLNDDSPIEIADEFFISEDGEMKCAEHAGEGWDSTNDYSDSASDTPTHCDDPNCDTMLRQPLTEDGVYYTLDALTDGSGDARVLATWADQYQEQLRPGAVQDVREVFPENPAVGPEAAASKVEAMDFVLGRDGGAHAVRSVEPVGEHFTRIRFMENSVGSLLAPNDLKLTTISVD